MALHNTLQYNSVWFVAFVGTWSEMLRQDTAAAMFVTLLVLLLLLLLLSFSSSFFIIIFLAIIFIIIIIIIFLLSISFYLFNTLCAYAYSRVKKQEWY